MENDEKLEVLKQFGFIPLSNDGLDYAGGVIYAIEFGDSAGNKYKVKSDDHLRITLHSTKTEQFVTLYPNEGIVFKSIQKLDGSNAFQYAYHHIFKGVPPVLISIDQVNQGYIIKQLTNQIEFSNSLDTPSFWQDKEYGFEFKCEYPSTAHTLSISKINSSFKELMWTNQIAHPDKNMRLFARSTENKVVSTVYFIDEQNLVHCMDGPNTLVPNNATTILDFIDNAASSSFKIEYEKETIQNWLDNQSNLIFKDGDNDKILIQLPFYGLTIVDENFKEQVLKQQLVNSLNNEWHPIQETTIGKDNYSITQGYIRLDSDNKPYKTVRLLKNQVFLEEFKSTAQAVEFVNNLNQNSMSNTEKFPVNRATVAGLVINEIDNAEQKRSNVKIATKIGNKDYIVNVLFSGKQYDELKSQNLDISDKPLLLVEGQGHFSSTEDKNGTKHQNFSIIANKFEAAVTEEQKSEFRKEHNSNNKENFQLKVRCDLSKDIENKDGFAVTSIKHTYMQNDERKSMFANVVIPKDIAAALSSSKMEKGTPVFLTAVPQNKSYENKQGNTAYTFSLITQQITADLTKTVSINKAEKAIDELASEINSKTKKNEKEEKVEAAKEKLNQRGM
jgi:single-stranded DNA-binding protein